MHNDRELQEVVLAKAEEAKILRLFPADVKEYIEATHQAIRDGAIEPEDPEEPETQTTYVATKTTAFPQGKFVLGKPHTNVIAANIAILRHMRHKYPNVMKRSEDQWICDEDLKPEKEEIAYFMNEFGHLSMAIEDIRVVLRVKKVESGAEQGTEHKN